MIVKLVPTFLVLVVLASEASAIPARSRAVVPSKTANHISPDRSGKPIRTDEFGVSIYRIVMKINNYFCNDIVVWYVTQMAQIHQS